MITIHPITLDSKVKSERAILRKAAAKQARELAQTKQRPVFVPVATGYIKLDCFGNLSLYRDMCCAPPFAVITRPADSNSSLAKFARIAKVIS